MEKQCLNCGQIKSLSEYHSKSPTRLNGNCKVCAIEISKEWYKKNKQEKKTHQRLKNNYEEAVRRFKKLIIIIKEKVGGCVVCGELDECCLDFHHVDKTLKEKEISHLAKNKSIKGIAKEIKKCICVCSNCHRKIHAGKIKIDLFKTIDFSFEELTEIYESIKKCQ